MKSIHSKLFVLSFVACSIPSIAHADAGPKIESGLYLPIGVTIGGAFGDDRSGGLVIGGEASLAYLHASSGFWGGLYGDALYDTGISGARYTFGPEVGVSIFGFDGGLAVQKANGKTEWGWTGRALVTFSILAGYIRLAHFSNAEISPGQIEVGILFKLPAPLWTEVRKRPWLEHRPAPPVEEPKKPDEKPIEPPKPEETPPPIVPVDPPK